MWIIKHHLALCLMVRAYVRLFGVLCEGTCTHMATHAACDQLSTMADDAENGRDPPFGDSTSEGRESLKIAMLAPPPQTVNRTLESIP